jgi:hypothetical protein
MDDSKYKIGPITVRWGRNKYKYYVIGESFYSEWNSGMDHSTSCWSLLGLSPDLIETVGRSSSTTRTVRISMLLIASSGIVFFSDYNKSIPLLAPFLFGLGAWWIINAVSTLLPRRWTEARALNGETVFSVVQPAEKANEWLEFQQALAGAIREANETKP